MRIVNIFAVLTGILGLIADIITIVTFFFTETLAPSSAHSSFNSLEIVALSFALFYGWLILSSALILHAGNREPWASKIRKAYFFLEGSHKFDLAFRSTFAIGIFIWPILTIFLVVLWEQFPQSFGNSLFSANGLAAAVLACAFISTFIQVCVGFAITLALTTWISLLIEE